MANRDLNFTPDVNTVVTKNPDELMVGLAHIADQIGDANEQSKLLVSGAQMNAQFKGLDAQFRMDYAGDPTNADGLRKLGEDRQSVADTFGEQISPFYQRQWQQKTAELAAQSSAANDLWTVHQNSINAVNNVKVTAKTFTDTANADGRALGASGSTDGSAVMNFATAQQQLEQFGNSHLGAERTSELLRNFKTDYAKSFISGVAETSPVQALKMLNDTNFSDNFTTEEKGELIDQIARVKRQQALAQTMTATTNNAALPDIVNDTSTTYYEKRATIDQLDMAGSITPKAAAQARRVIRSSEDVDTQTDTPVMADIINKVYDLNATSGTDAASYLHGVQNLQETILDNQASGQLTARDAQKLNKQLTDLTSKRIADSTQTVGNNFYDANQQFNVLPPENRAAATRQLFYASDGKNFTPAQYKAQAQAIIDDTNATLRTNALKVATATSQNDAAFLRSIKATPDDVTATAQKYHISEQEVLRQLRLNHLGKRTSVRSVAPDSPEGAPADSGKRADPVTLRDRDGNPIDEYGEPTE